MGSKKKSTSTKGSAKTTTTSKVVATSLPKTAQEFEQLVLDNMYHMHGQAVQSASAQDLYMALCYTVRDYLIERWRKTTETRYEANPKFVYYLSAEFLPGKQLEQNMLYTDTRELAEQACANNNLELTDYLQLDLEPGLGNGGLGRLAACFIDSLATLDIPAVGYGIRYEFGIFKQVFHDGWQVEQPDNWLVYGNPWEFPQADEMVTVQFWGHTEVYRDNEGNHRRRWVSDRAVRGEPYTTLVPGYETQTVNILRLWRARASEEFDFQLFDTGDYTRTVEEKVRSETISKVLYPNDSTPQGRQLRLQQQYFFVACSLRDILRRFRLCNDDWGRLPEKVAIQLNDTHPVVAIPELMRILVDEEGLAWDRAWKITRGCFAYTCHTLLPEALEKWPVDMFGSLLPRHLEIVYEINRRFLAEVGKAFPNDLERLQKLSIIEEEPYRQIRMANLAVVGSSVVNGVAELQSRLLQQRTLPEFAEMHAERFQNKTNGVTPRRFMRLANPELAELISGKIGSGWLKELDQLQQLEAYVDDAQFRRDWWEVKRLNKCSLAKFVQDSTGVELLVDSLFDVMVKRLHEYKRQLLKALHIVWLYHRTKADPQQELVPRTFFFGAKAAPGYQMAKLIIKLIHNIGNVINSDTDIDGRLKIAFPANFNVTMAQSIYPAANVSEQISMAGKEASGTGNMKFALNGAVTVGTLDGANIEIRERVGDDNFFLFGLDADEVVQLKQQGYRPLEYYNDDIELRAAIDAIAMGQFSDGDRELFRPIIDSLLNHDEYMLLADFRAYVSCSETAAAVFRDREHWTRMSILNTARCGFFSSDRTIQEYCNEIWGVTQLAVC